MTTMRLTSAALAAAAMVSCANSPVAARQGAAGGAEGVRVPGLSGPDAALAYPAAFFPGAAYDAGIPTPDNVMGFTLGERPATYTQLKAAFEALAESSDRATLVEYATSYEGRSLYYLVITDPSRVGDGDDPFADLKRDLRSVADPRSTDAADAERLAGQLPAVAWMAYAIHGNECSGADAALAAAYHLTASTSAETAQMLEDLVVVIDPLMNPDGRDRYINRLDESRSTQPAHDNQSMAHRGQWPSGRTNHYLFDLNRDWILGVHPETRGRIEAIDEWHPLLLVDAHEMGSLDTYLFSPSREPVNPNLPQRRKHWWDVFALDQGAAFDAFGWRYYTGEWNEEWYPGYTSSWAGFRGAVGILYEQARVAPDGIKRPEGTVLTYRESVHHQVVSTMANLDTLQANRAELYEEFLAERRQNVSADAPHADRVFAIRPWNNHGRMRIFLELMQVQGFDVFVADEAFSAARAENQLGIVSENAEFPAGTLLIPNRQPEAPLVSAMLEFDPRMSEEFLRWSRREILRADDPKLYDVTSWNLTMMHGVPASVISASDVPATSPLELGDASGGVENAEALVAWVIDGVDDNAAIAAARLMEAGVEVRAANKAFEIGGTTFARGSVVVTRNDNQLLPGSDDELIRTIDRIAQDLAVRAIGIDSSLGIGVENPDLGGEHFELLERPRIALVGGPDVSSYGYGTAWHAIDQRLGVPVALLTSTGFGGVDLRRYNTLIIPSTWGPFLREHQAKISEWVESGGTLVAMDNSARQLASEESGLSRVRQLPDVLDNLHDYEITLLREITARTEQVDTDAIWDRDAAGDVAFPWDHEPGEDEESAPDLSLPATDELERRDEWQSVFMPAGVMLAGRIDDRHWLTFGDEHMIPLLMGNNGVLMTKPPVDAAVRVGMLIPEDDLAARRVGWAVMPEGQRLLVRMSGLLWPEAAERLANAAAITRERHGNGQVILFASEPNFRGATLATQRFFLNAIVFGPGMGASHPIIP